jgi:hypothetical protein
MSTYVKSAYNNYPTCTSCEYYKDYNSPLTIGDNTIYCKHPDVEEYDVVSGSKEYPLCSQVRDPAGYFGLNCSGYVKRQQKEDWDWGAIIRNVFGI